MQNAADYHKGHKIMSDTQDTQKTLEVKIRSPPGKERPDQKDVSRVFLSIDALLDLGVESGMPIYLWKMDEPESRRYEAIAWLAPQKMHKNIVQMYPPFREICRFRLEDRIGVAPAGDLQVASCVVLRDTTSTPMPEKDKPHWEWYVAKKLERAETIFSGMGFHDLALEGSRRSFTVELFVVGGRVSQRGIVRFTEESSVTFGRDVLREEGPVPVLRLPEVPGLEKTVQEINEFLATFSLSPKEYGPFRRSLGLLLSGAHGTGKTLLIQKLCGLGWGDVFHVKSHMKQVDIRKLFVDAGKSTRSIIVLDDVHRIVSREDAKYPVEELLCEELDRLSTALPATDEKATKTLLLAATAATGDIPNSLRYPGRITEEVFVPLPDADARKRILKSFHPKANESQESLLEDLGERTYAYTARDLELLNIKAWKACVQRNLAIDKASRHTDLTKADIEYALHEVKPSAMHDVTLRPRKVRWDEIGGQSDVKVALQRSARMIKYADVFRRLGGPATKGVLLYGPPGCSKTLSAQAMATELGFNFFAVKGAELLNMYVGESERAVREVFARARAASPSIIFFDEIESIGGKRQSGRSGGVNVLTTLLNEMDGIETLEGVTILAATNKPEALDLALLRPGRFDDLLYVAPPDLEARLEILNVWKNKMDWAEDVDIPALALRTSGYSGAEIVGICQSARNMVFDRICDTGDFAAKIQMDNFEKALSTVKPQISTELIEGYKKWAAGVRSGSV
jgi:AAA family ATPase